MNKILKRLIFLITCIVSLTLAAETKYTYDTREWMNINSAAMQMLNNDRTGSRVPFKPCLINNDFVAAKCKIVEYYDCAIYFDPDKRAVIYVDDKARADYYVIFADATNVNMGPGGYELFIECNISPTKSYDLLYDLRTNQARKLADGDMNTMSRFARRVPHINYKNPHDKISKLLHEYFRELSEGDYVEAEKARRKIIMKANQDQGIDSDVLQWDNTTIFNAYPLMELGEALMLSYPTKYRERESLTIARDPFEGYKYVKQVFRLDTLLNEANSVLLSGDIRLSVDMIKKNVETELINYARWEGTEEAYDRVLMTLYNSPLRNDARSEQEKIVYSKIAGSQSKDDFIAYLNKFKGVDEGHFNFIEQRLFQVAFEQMPATAQGCKEYLSNYPLSPHADEVRAKVSEYAYQELQPTAASCRKFLNEYPHSPHAEEVWYRVYELAYNEIGDNLELCEKYLIDYPNSQYCDQVRRKILKIKYDRAVAAGTVAAYDQFLKENSYNSYTEDIQNRRAALTGGGSSHVTPIDTNYQPATHQRPQSEVRQPAVQSQQPAVQSQRPATQSQQPALQSQQPASQSQQPATQSQRPAAQTQQQAKPAPKKPAQSTQKQQQNGSNNSNSSTGTLWELDF